MDLFPVTNQPNASGSQAPLVSLPHQDNTSTNNPLKPSHTSKPSNSPHTSNPLKPSHTSANSSSKPPTDELAAIFEAFQLHKDGRLARQPWPKFPLSRTGYSKLQEALEDDTPLNGYIKDKVRYDYVPSRYQLVIRMPSNFHELVIGLISDEIKAQLKSIGAGQSPSSSADSARDIGQSSNDFARDIIAWYSTDILPLDKYYGKHTPDASFGHCNTILPSLILEVSWTQKLKDLPELADDYLLGSNGNIQAMIGIDLEYKGTKATLSIWEVVTIGTDMDIRQVVANEVFRGSTVTSTGLRIPLTYFANSTIRAQYQPIVGDIFISTAQLCTLVDKAEAQYSLMQSRFNGQGGINVDRLPPGVIKHRHKATPPEELLKVDKFEASEHYALKKMDTDAGSSFDSSEGG